MRSGKVGPGSLHYVRRSSPQHLHAALLSEMIDLPRVELVFMVVRDPIARFRSEYAMRQKDPSKTDAASVDAWAERAWPATREPLRARQPPPAAARVPAPGQPRSTGSRTACRRMVDDLEERFGLGLTAGLDHRLKSSERHGIASRDVQISPTLEKTLRELYAEDFRQFGF